MERTQHQHESAEDYFPPPIQAAPLLDRIRHSAQALAARAANEGQEPFRMMHRIATELEEVTAPLIRAVDHCNEFLAQPGLEHDVALLRDATHLHARIEAMVAQLEDTVHTLERLVERPASLLGTPSPALSGDGSPERIEPTTRPSLRRALRGLTPYDRDLSLPRRSILPDRGAHLPGPFFV